MYLSSGTLLHVYILRSLIISITQLFSSFPNPLWTLIIVGVSHILGLGVCISAGVTGSCVPWDAKSGVDRLVVYVSNY